MLVDIGANEAWNDSLYRDEVHPTVKGNAVLAAILSSAIAQSLGSSSQASIRQKRGQAVLGGPKT
jgi:hypothetical protein